MVLFILPGNKTNKEVDDDDDEFLHLENLDSDSLRDEDVGPVLQVKAGAGFAGSCQIKISRCFQAV